MIVVNKKKTRLHSYIRPVDGNLNVPGPNGGYFLWVHRVLPKRHALSYESKILQLISLQATVLLSFFRNKPIWQMRFIPAFTLDALMLSSNVNESCAHSYGPLASIFITMRTSCGFNIFIR